MSCMNCSVIIMITRVLIKCAHMRQVKQNGWIFPTDPLTRELHPHPLASHVRQAVFLCPFRQKSGCKEVKAMTSIPVINMKATGQNTTRLRQQAGLSVANLQQIFGFSTPQAIYKWQRGTALPTVDNLVVLAAVFNTGINNILVLS